MNPKKAADIIKTCLNTYLTDPYLIVSPKTSKRAWIHTDLPLSSATFPRIQIKKIAEQNEIISMGTNYRERRIVFFNILFYSQPAFGITIDNEKLSDDRFIEYYLSVIRDTLKAQQTYTQGQGIDGYKVMDNSNEVIFDEQMGVYPGFLTVRYWWFV